MLEAPYNRYTHFDVFPELCPGNPLPWPEVSGSGVPGFLAGGHKAGGKLQVDEPISAARISKENSRVSTPHDPKCDLETPR